MAVPIARRIKMAIVPVIAAFFVAVPVLALNVTPIIIDLLSTGRQTSSIITLENTFAESVPIELSVRPLRVVDGELREIEDEEPDDLLVFPPQTTVAGGQSQAFRVQWVGDPAPAASQHYYVTVSQLPVQLPGNQSVVQVLHRFKVLVSVGIPGGRPQLEVVGTEIVKDEAGKVRPVLTIRNSGNTYGYLGRGSMTIVQRAPGGEEVFRQSMDADTIQRQLGLGLVPSGTTRRLPLNLELPQEGGALSVELTASPSTR